MIGRRVQNIDEITQPGDYALVVGYTGDKPAVFFLLPGSRDENATAERRSLHHVTSPPHTFRECSDGSLEIRASIASYTSKDGKKVMTWHGYLDEGHIWREV